MNRARRLLTLWFAVALAAVVLPAALVAAVDPFGYFRTNTAGYYHSSEREFKRGLVRGANYNALILGDSRIAYTDPSLIKLPQYRFLNGGLGGGGFRDQVNLLLNSKLDALKLVVMGLLSPRGGDCAAGLDGKRSPLNSLWEPIRYSAAWTQIWYAAQTLAFKARGHEPYYREDGTRISTGHRQNEAALTERNANYWRVIWHNTDQFEAHFRDTRGITFSDSCLNLIGQIQALADRHGFRLLLVFLPINRDLLNQSDWYGWLHGDHSQRQIARLRSVARNVVVFSDSAYSDSTNFWRFDSQHFKPEVGARLIEEAIRRSEALTSN